LAFVAVLFIKEVPLRTTIQRADEIESRPSPTAETKPLAPLRVQCSATTSPTACGG
jgi:hypothetical protein